MAVPFTSVADLTASGNRREIRIDPGQGVFHMRVTAKEYRDQLYRLRAHPGKPSDGFNDSRDSLMGLYISLLPFVVVEYMVEAQVNMTVSGLVFPLGFLLFWGFYYTYYKPGFLEDHLVIPKTFDLVEIPTLLLGVAIWFVKVSVWGLLDLLFLNRFLQPGKREIHVGKKSQYSQAQRPRPQQTQTNYQAPSQSQAQRPGPRPVQTPPLPAEVLSQLAILGLGETRDWNLVHKRYRELAKQYHPDLNHDITQAGRRFMTFDAAYRKLLNHKEKYFFEVKR